MSITITQAESTIGKIAAGVQAGAAIASVIPGAQGAAALAAAGASLAQEILGALEAATTPITGSLANIRAQVDALRAQANTLAEQVQDS
jgi:hypothetical protein